MTLQKIIKNSGTAFDFTNYPVRIGTTVATDVNYSVTGYGLSVANGSSGLCIYDTSIKPVAGSVNVVPGTPLVFPFRTDKLPTTYFDAIVELVVDGIKYPQGFSSSPDNLAASTQRTIPANKNLFWCSLYCFGDNNGFGNSNTNNKFMFGGNSKQLNSVNLELHFSEVLSAPIDLRYIISFFSYTKGLITNTIKDITITIPANVIDFATGYIKPELIAGDYRDRGYFTVELIVNNPNFESLLPFYHWGLAY